ncbi:MAG: tRNA/rRNA methyltransferase [Prolixibacteraceae bacterium]|nr:tRNA/rRNA methyltransferase [Prolixibacteraceae bacterium]
MQISFLLVEPAVPENVGAAARAMKTMGFVDLILVNPCDYLSGPSQWLAHGSTEILEKARVFRSLKEALSEFDLVIGTTAKRRSVKSDYYYLTELPALLEIKGNVVNKTVIVFGREESGLSNDELKLCDLVTTVPMSTAFPSLNLSQAVMLYAWELSKNTDLTDQGRKYRQDESLKELNKKVREVLLVAGFKEESAIFSRFFERINALGEDDIHLLHSLCNKLLGLR